MKLWPFSTAELTAGLRRYFAEPKLQVKSLAERPLAASPAMPSVVGLRVDYTAGAGVFSLDCIVKEPRGASRAGLAGAGLREVGLYQSLADQLPVATPALIAADSRGDWLVLEDVGVPAPPQAWQAQDYQRAVRALASLHERFWGLADDLAVYNWLARPLTVDYEIHVYAAAQAVEKMMVADWPRLITRSMKHLSALGQIISQVESIITPLQLAPHTLLHGDFWPGNVALLPDDDMVVMDWQAVSLGPGILDVAVLVMKSQWQAGALPVAPEALAGLYRDEIAARLGVSWTDDIWQTLWDCALLWRFVQEMFTWLANTPREEFSARQGDFERLWLEPVLAAVERRLRPVLHF